MEKIHQSNIYDIFNVDRKTHSNKEKTVRSTFFYYHVFSINDKNAMKITARH